ncbi:MAG TPA: thiamine pyrophosphate-dependent enzyme [Nitrososphaeraceae archaeon]|jgi:acetolactate synthase-1/2/3 large subunit|nr:thiamine pyrophosphate-dependent enzyme [Nitrososphaeraceae archaeon]
MKASDLFIKCLEEEGTEYIFGLPGEENADLMISLMDSKKIRFILVRHEQAAAFMADVYGRLTQKVGICLSTLGPGATNLTTGVANANMDRSPIVAITGQTHSELLHKESHQNMDVITMFKSITKWNWSIRNSDTIPEIVRRAFKTSLQEKAGATHIELTQDIAKHESAIIPLKPCKSLRARPPKSLIMKTVKLILGSKKPLILIGNGCVRGNASQSLREFVLTTGIFSVNTFMAKGVVSDRFDTHLQTIGIKEADHVLISVKEADLVIAIGYDLVEYSAKHWNSDLNKNIIHIDFTPAEVDTYYSPTIEIAADIEYTVEAITSQLREQIQNKVHSRVKNKSKSPNVRAYLEQKYIHEPFKKVKKEVEWRSNEKFKNDLSFPIKPEKLVYDVRTALDENDIVISDVGVHKLWIAKLYNTFRPNTCLIPNGFCSMGFALPSAIAAQLVKPAQKVVAMCGDGGFLMNVQEIETAVRLSLPIIIIVWCDCDFGMISLKQTNEFGKSGFTRFMNPNFVKLAESFGAIGYSVKSTAEFANVLKKARSSTTIPVIISIDVDYTRNRLLLNDEFTGLQVGHFAG